MKYSEISKLSLQELTKKQAKLKKSLFELKMKNKLGQLTNPIEIRHSRRELAKIFTAINAGKAQ